MKAQVLYGVGDIRLEERSAPKPERGEVLVRVAAAGICGSDIPRIYETGAHKMPLIPGHEFAGVVDSVGDGADKGLIGRRVGAFPLIPCGVCEQCKKGQYQRCTGYDYTGSRRDGAFAEFVAVPEKNLITIDDGVSMEAAAMSEPMAVAVHAMRRGLSLGLMKEAPGAAEAAEYLADKRIAVMGLGTIGLLLAMFLRDAGAENIYLAGNRQAQLDRAEALGFPRERLYAGKEAARWLNETAGGADLFFECVGREESVKALIDGAAPGAAGVVVGNPHGDMRLPKDIYWKILRNEIRLSGTWNSGFFGGGGDDWHYALGRVMSGGVEPTSLITHRLKLCELKRGLEIMRDKTEDYCKIMIFN